MIRLHENREEITLTTYILQDSPELLKGKKRPAVLVCPARNVTENTPPTFLWATAEDELVPVQHSIRMAHALADKHIPFEMHIFEEGPHGLGLADQATAEAKSQIYPDAAKWADLAGEWLKKRFALPLPEMSSFEEMMNGNMDTGK